MLDVAMHGLLSACTSSLLTVLQLEVGSGAGSWQYCSDERCRRPVHAAVFSSAMLNTSPCRLNGLGILISIASRLTAEHLHAVASETPLSALYLGRLAQEAGFPPGVVNIIVVRSTRHTWQYMPSDAVNLASCCARPVEEYSVSCPGVL